MDIQLDAAAPAAGRPAADAGGHRRGPRRGWPSHGYDPVYGARPLRRLVQTAIGDQLAKALLAGEIRDGDTVRVDLADDKDGLGLA